MSTATATLDAIRPWTDAQHPTDSAKVAAIVGHVLSVGRWDLPPVLVIESEGNGATVLDGHHRCAAARSLHGSCVEGASRRIPIPDHEVDVETIPAYVLTVADYCAILETHFDGTAPPRLADLDPYILVDGAPYVRQDDGHV